MKPIIWTKNRPEYKVAGIALKDRSTVETLVNKYNTESSDYIDAEKMSDCDFNKLAGVISSGIVYHDTGKITGCWSLDGSATSCTYCQKMTDLAIRHPELNIVCGSCYDRKQEESFKGTNTQVRHEITQAVMSRFLLSVAQWKILLMKVPEFSFFRFNSSGDLENVTEAQNHIRAAKARLDLHAAQWTKNIPVWKKAVDAENGRPENLRGILSTCILNGKPLDISKLARYFDETFTVYTEASTVNAGNQCACVIDVKHSHCIECGFKCYKKETEGGWKYGTNTVEQLRKK